MRAGKKTGRITGIPKLEDANDAGTKNAMDCTLILTEGASCVLVCSSAWKETLVRQRRTFASRNPKYPSANPPKRPHAEIVNLNGVGYGR